MDELYELKEMLCKELKEYGEKGEMTAGSLEVIDKLTHAIKNLDKIIEKYEEEGEGSYAGGSYAGNRRRYSNRGSRYSNEGGRGGNAGGGGSYARGRGRGANRDSMGRYSRESGYSRDGEEMAMQLREMMEDAPDEKTRMEIERLANKMEQM